MRNYSIPYPNDGIFINRQQVLNEAAKMGIMLDPQMQNMKILAESKNGDRRSFNNVNQASLIRVIGNIHEENK